MFMMLCDETLTHIQCYRQVTQSWDLGWCLASCCSDNTKPVMPFWWIFILEHISTFNVNTRNNILLNFYQSEHRTEQSECTLAHWMLHNLRFHVFQLFKMKWNHLHTISVKPFYTLVQRQRTKLGYYSLFLLHIWFSLLLSVGTNFIRLICIYSNEKRKTEKNYEQTKWKR